MSIQYRLRSSTGGTPYSELRMSKIRLTSLLLVEERLLEAAYFAQRLKQQRDSDRFRYELNAFLAAARSVTFVLQKEMSAVAGFARWWDRQRKALAEDPAAVYFLKLRNFSQKEGRVSVVGSTSTSGRKRRWSYRFAGNEDRVPAILLHRDVAECCREHVSKLAKIILDCTDVFPHHSCPRRALTAEGIAALKLSLEDIEETIGLPRGWTKIDDPAGETRRIEALRDEVDGLDFVSLNRIARWKPRDPVTGSSAPLHEDVLTSLVEQLEENRCVSTVDLAVSLVVGVTGVRRRSNG